MAKWKCAKSGGEKYTIKLFSDRDLRVRKDDAWTRDGGTLLGNVSSLEEAIALIKVNSGAKQVDLRDC